MIKSQFVTSEPIGLSNCDREPIHLSGAIQPHGMLLALESSALRVVALSANCEAFIGTAPHDVLNGRLTEVLHPKSFELLEHSLVAADPGRYNPVRTSLRPGLPDFDASVHRAGATVIVEFEPAPPRDEANPLRALRSCVEHVQVCASVDELCASLVKDVRELTGFDRVMVYRFDPDWHGEVIAEFADADLTPYLNLHFPASDIPRQARELYARNWMRLIPDALYTPVPIVPNRGPAASAPLDLSGATLRSVSPLHLEYLRNMGVSASMSVSLICEGRLWGLIACHHRVPRHIAYEVRTACELLARVASTQIVALQGRERHAAGMRHAMVQTQLMEAMSQRSDLSAALVESKQTVLDLFDAGGAAVRIGAQQPRLLGATPDASDVMDIIAWLQQRRDNGVFSTASLAADHEPFARFAGVASGLLALPISRSAGSYVLWFRPESARTIDWGGDPNKAVDADPSGAPSPRKSFETWRQVIANHAAPWLPLDEQAAADFGRAIGDYLLRENDELVELNRELARSNTDLDAFAHMTSHDLKEPLRGIHNYANHVLEDCAGLDAEAQAKLNGIIRLTRRMDDLLASLLHFAGAGRGPVEHRRVDLGKVVVEALEMLGARLDEQSVSVVIDAPLATVSGDAAHLRDIFVNLLSNAAKYNDKAERWISVAMVEGDADADEPASTVTVAVVDNGIGIPADQHEAIFRLFKRMHARDAFGGGSGAGLAIVRKLLERMGGSIRVESVPGEGSTFFVTLPR